MCIHVYTFRRALCSAVAVIISNKGITSWCPAGHARAMPGLLSGGKGRTIAQMIQMRNNLSCSLRVGGEMSSVNSGREGGGGVPGYG